MTVGERIKRARKKARMTQKQLGDKLGVSYVVISQYENGARNPKIETLEKIAKALNISDFELIFDEADIEPNILVRAWLSGKVDPAFTIDSEDIKVFSQAQEEIRKGMAELAEVFMHEQAEHPVWVLRFFDRLNHTGRIEAARRVEEMTKIEEYTKSEEKTTDAYKIAMEILQKYIDEASKQQESPQKEQEAPPQEEKEPSILAAHADGHTP